MRIQPAVLSIEPPSACLPPGFTLIELLIATVVLAVGLLALTSVGASTVKLESRGQQLFQIAAAGETRLELLRAERCLAGSGVSNTGDVTEHWSVTESLPRTRIVVDSVARDDGSSVAPARIDVFRSAFRC